MSARASGCLRGGLASGSGHNDSSSGSHGGRRDGGECAWEVVCRCGGEKFQDKDEGNEQRDIMPMFVLERVHERARGEERYNSGGPES